MPLSLYMLFSVITPSTGHPNLHKLLTSLDAAAAGYTVEHILVVDGPAHAEKAAQQLTAAGPPSNLTRHVVNLPFPTGINRYMGHKIYAGFSQLVSGIYVIFCDDDNFVEPDFIANYAAMTPENKEWAYCFRNIVDYTGTHICKDACESLGHVSNVFYDPNRRLIDTSCYCIRRDVIVKIAHVWNAPLDPNGVAPDFLFPTILMKDFPNYHCTQKYSLNYMVNNRSAQSVSADLFLQGNKIIGGFFGTDTPDEIWQRKIVYLAHFDEERTADIIQNIYQHSKTASRAFQQWQFNLLDTLRDKNLLVLSAYHNPIPTGATVWVHMCFPEKLPLTLLRRKDVRKILYTFESPNVRHQTQWSTEFLETHFDEVITYWKPLLQRKLTTKYTYYPFVHRLDFSNMADMASIRTNVDNRRSCCIILENRQFCGEFHINGVRLSALDYLRAEYAAHIPNMYCYGESWREFCKIHRNATYCEVPSRFLDMDRTIDYMVGHTFTLIIENVNAAGYVSEKIYDALMSGSIPLYYGNADPELIPANLYIDLRQISPDTVEAYLNAVDVERYRQNIYQMRNEVLMKVSVNKYADMMETVISL